MENYMALTGNFLGIKYIPIDYNIEGHTRSVSIPEILDFDIEGLIDIRDIVDVAAKVLTEAGHEGKTYGLTGPASISFHDIAAELSKALGKEVKYVDVPPEAGREGMLGMGLPEWVADAMTEYSKAFSEGFGDFTTNDVEEITGHPARSYETFARDFAQAFAPAPAP